LTVVISKPSAELIFDRHFFYVVVQVVSCLLTRRATFDFRPGPLEFGVDEVTLGDFFLK